jgi:hypothetical protein
MCPDWNRQRWLTPNAGWQQKIGRSGPAPKVKAALEILGCMGGKLEKETEARGYFEVDDAKCKDDQYGIKLDKDFKMIAMTRD